MDGMLPLAAPPRPQEGAGVRIFLRGAMDGLAAVPPLAGELGGGRLAAAHTG
jgi:hypothetical protein